MKHTFLHISPFFSSGRGPFLALSAAGHAGGVCSRGKLRAPAALRGACSGRSKSLELESNHGIAFPLAEPRRTMETPQCCTILALLLLYHVCVTPCPKLSSSLIGGSHGITAAAHQVRLLLRRPRAVRLCACRMSYVRFCFLST